MTVSFLNSVRSVACMQIFTNCRAFIAYTPTKFSSWPNDQFSFLSSFFCFSSSVCLFSALSYTPIYLFLFLVISFACERLEWNFFREFYAKKPTLVKRSLKRFFRAFTKFLWVTEFGVRNELGTWTFGISSDSASKIDKLGYCWQHFLINQRKVLANWLGLINSCGGGIDTPNTSFMGEKTGFSTLLYSHRLQRAERMQIACGSVLYITYHITHPWIPFPLFLEIALQSSGF